MSDTPEVIPPKRNTQNDRTRASRIRLRMRAGTATPEEILWLEEYDKDSPGPGNPGRSRGASAHRRVSYTEEESAAAGEGASSVAQMAVAASMVREEGRREDSLADKGMAALERAFSRQERLVEFMMARMQLLEDSHLEMWAAHRDSRLREVDAEIELTRAQAESEGKDDNVSQMAAELLPHLLKQLKGPR